MLTKVRSKEGAKMGLKAWLGILVDLLEDGDGNVRDQAREVSRPLPLTYIKLTEDDSRLSLSSYRPHRPHPLLDQNSKGC